MKVLMISGDPGVLDPKSETGQRMQEYRQALGELDILLCRRNIFNFIFGFFRGLEMMRKRYDIITAQDMEHSFLAWIFSKIFGVPWQMQIHTDIFSPYFVKNSNVRNRASNISNKIRVALARFLIPRANCIRVMSERIKKSMTWWLSRQVGRSDRQPPIVVLPVFVDIEKIKNMPVKTDLHEKYGRDKFIILMASRITKEKNIDLAIEALRDRLIRTNKPILLLIVGDGPELANLKLQTINYQLQTNVVFESYTSDLASYYKTCDLFLLTSNYEGYGRTLMEAAVSGCKIISTKEDLKQKLILALENKLPAPRLPALPTKEEYLKLYKNSFEVCLKK